MTKSTPRRLFSRRCLISLVLSVLLLLSQIAMTAGALPSGRPTDMTGLVLTCAQLAVSALVLVLNLGILPIAARELSALAPGSALFALLGYGVCYGYSLHSVLTGTFHIELLSCAVLMVTGWDLCHSLSVAPGALAAQRLAGLKNLIPQKALLTRDSATLETPLDAFEVGDLFVTNAGERFAFDGRVITGTSSADESALTGTPGAVEKIPGNRVLAGSLNLTNSLTCMVSALGPYTSLGRVTLKYKKVTGILSRAAGAPRRHPLFWLQLLLACGVTLFWLLLNRPLPFALGCGVCLLFCGLLGFSCCIRSVVALQATDRGLAMGLVFDTPAVLEQAGRVKNVVMTKSTTVTNLTPRVSEIYAKGLPERFLMGIAASLSIKSTYPLAESVMDYATAQGIRVHPAVDFEDLEGRGMTGKVSTKASAAGGLEFIRSVAEIPEDVLSNGLRMEEAGCETIYFSVGGVAVGVVGCVPVVNLGFAPAVAALKAMGLHTVLLTPDEPRVAANLGRQAGLDEVVGDLEPSRYVAEVARLQAEAPTALIGNFARDEDALRKAGLSVTLGMEKNAGLSLLRARPEDLAAAVQLSRSVPPRREMLLKKARSWHLFSLLPALLLPPLMPAPLGIPAALALLMAGQMLTGRVLLNRALNPSAEELALQTLPTEEEG